MRTLLGALAVILLVVAAYSRTLDVPLLFDDIGSIERNERIQLTELDPGALFDILVERRRPLAYFSLALNHLAGGLEPRGYHIVNIALHALTGVLVLLFSRLIFRRALHLAGRLAPAVPGGEITLATLSALLFVAHPIQTQAVTYIVQRMSVLATLFYVLALLLFVLGRERSAGPGRLLLWVGCVFCGVLAMGSKPIAAPLPVAIFGIEWFFYRDLSGAWLRRQLRWLAPLGGAGVGLGWVYWTKVSAIGYADFDFTLWERLLTQFRVVGILYPSLLVWPAPSCLNLLHEISTSRSLLEPASTLLGLLLLLGVASATVFLSRRERVLGFALLWYILHLLIESSFLPLAMVYEHRLYLPMVGVSLGCVWLLFRICSPRPGIAVVLALASIALLATTSHVRNQTWRDPVRFWDDVVTKSPKNPKAVYNLGVAYEQKNLLPEATAVYERLVELAPDLPDAHLRLGVAYALANRIEDAVFHFREELRVDPESEKGRELLDTGLEILRHQRERAAPREP